MKLCITGANSSVGRNLLQHVAALSDCQAVALVRTPAAFSTLPTGSNIEPVAQSYEDHAALVRAFSGAQVIVHLAGVLFESKGSTYQSANVDSTAQVVRAAQAAAVPQVIFISVLGADASSSNPFYRSKGEAERIVTSSGLVATVLRTPLLLSADSAGGRALLREAGAGRATLLGGGRHLVRPLDVDDLSAAILAACRKAPATQVLELCGPQRVPYHQLVTMLAAMLERKVEITALPLWLAKLLSGITHALKGAGMSPAIIDVISASEDVHENADAVLNLTLTPLAQTLAKLQAARSAT